MYLAFPLGGGLEVEMESGGPPEFQVSPVGVQILLEEVPTATDACIETEMSLRPDEVSCVITAMTPIGITG